MNDVFVVIFEILRRKSAMSICVNRVNAIRKFRQALVLKVQANANVNRNLPAWNVMNVLSDILIMLLVVNRVYVRSMARLIINVCRIRVDGFVK